jgi:hypothetical protein
MSAEISPMKNRRIAAEENKMTELEFQGEEEDEEEELLR